MAANNRSDIAIETAEAIYALIEKTQTQIASDLPSGDERNGLQRALSAVDTFVAALKLSQGPRIGRPRKPKAEA